MAQGVSIVRHTQVRAGKEEAYALWRGRLLSVIHESPGFITLEVHAPEQAQADWVTVEKFASLEDAQAWLNSDARRKLVADVDEWAEGPDSITLLTADRRFADRGVTAVIHNRVVPGREADFERWMRRIQTAQANYPGYVGVNVQAPIEGVSDEWVTLLRFDTAENLLNWLNSPEREALAQESEGLFHEADYRVANVSFRDWLPESERAEEPPLWKVNAIVLLVLYPVVVLTLVFVNPLINDLGLAPVTFVDNVIGVAATGFFLVPWAAKLLSGWLSPSGPKARLISIWGTVGMIVGYAILIAIMTLIAVNFSY